MAIHADIPSVITGRKSLAEKFLIEKRYNQDDYQFGGLYNEDKNSGV